MGYISHAPIVVVHAARVQGEGARVHQPRVQIVVVDGQGRIFATTIIGVIQLLIISSYRHLRMRNPRFEILIPLFGSQMRHRLLLNLFLDHISYGLYAIKRCLSLPSMRIIRLTVLVDSILAL